ncbi:MAG: hypothetical protein P1P90_02770 [Patescibacteria group bacterium]|nr:hypothetical protein [Patescibacteria group bacterium]
MVTIPYTLGPADDWDPQGYEEEEEDMIAPGMHVLDEDEEEEDDDELSDADAGLVNEPVLEDIEDEDEEEEIDEESSFKDLEKDALAELEELEDLVLQSERETLKLTDFTEEE